MIIVYIKENTIGDIIAYLEDKNIINSTSLFTLIINNIDRVKEEIDFSNLMTSLRQNLKK